jgi:hypothetical protein
VVVQAVEVLVQAVDPVARKVLKFPPPARFFL